MTFQISKIHLKIKSFIFYFSFDSLLPDRTNTFWEVSNLMFYAQSTSTVISGWHSEKDGSLKIHVKQNRRKHPMYPMYHNCFCSMTLATESVTKTLMVKIFRNFSVSNLWRTLDSRGNVGSIWWWCWYDGRKWSHFINRPEDWGVAVEQVWHRDRVGFDFDGHWLQVSLMVKDICLPCVLVKNNNTKTS